LKNKFTAYSLILLMVIGPLALRAQEEGEIRKVRFSGNDHFSDRYLRKQISFKPATWLEKTVFKKRPSSYSGDAMDMIRSELFHFYRSEGFLNMELGTPEIKTRGRKKKVELSFTIQEGEPIILDSIGYDILENPALPPLPSDWEPGKLKLTAKTGEPFRDALIWTDSDLISHYFINRGHPYARVVPGIKVDTARHTATLIWQVDRGPLGYFGNITIAGNKRTPDKTIMRQMAFKTGDLYSRKKLNKSQQQVYELGTFRIASVKAQLSKQQDDTIPVAMVFTEAPATATRVGFGYGREDKLRGFIDFRLLNFTGGARRLNIYLKHSALEPYHIEATLTQPGAFSANSTLAFSPSIRKMHEPGYELLTYGANLSLLQKITQKLSGSINWYYDKVILDTTTLARIASGLHTAQ
jgi:outer membrane protein insertion porin family